MSRTLRLPSRYYRALPIDDPGYEEEVFELGVAQTALVGMHCWNIGCPDGPPVDSSYCVGLGWPQSTEEAWRIMQEVMRPAMGAARALDMAVCHVESDWLDAPSRRSGQALERASGQAGVMAERAHGVRYLTDSPLARMRRAQLTAPVGDEPLVFYSDQLDEYLKKRDIDTLIYMGFAADMCLLNAEGGAFPMLGRG